MNRLERNFGATMERVCNDKGITLDKLEKLTGISKDILNKYEEGEIELSLNHADKIAEALCVPIDFLIYSSQGHSRGHRNLILSSRIKSIRWDWKISRKEFADRINLKLPDSEKRVSEDDVYEWDRGASIPTDKELEAITQLINMSIFELLYGIRDPFTPPFLFEILNGLKNVDPSELDLEEIENYLEVLNDCVDKATDEAIKRKRKDLDWVEFNLKNYKKTK